MKRLWNPAPNMITLEEAIDKQSNFIPSMGTVKTGTGMRELTAQDQYFDNERGITVRHTPPLFVPHGVGEMAVGTVSNNTLRGFRIGERAYTFTHLAERIKASQETIHHL